MIGVYKNVDTDNLVLSVGRVLSAAPHVLEELKRSCGNHGYMSYDDCCFVAAGYSHLRSPAVCGTTRDAAADCGRDEASPPPAAPPSSGFIHLRSPVYQLKEGKALIVSFRKKPSSRMRNQSYLSLFLSQRTLTAYVLMVILSNQEISL
jgi:hypothetical protein